jgi:hypothetical protein
MQTHSHTHIHIGSARSSVDEFFFPVFPSQTCEYSFDAFSSKSTGIRHKVSEQFVYGPHVQRAVGQTTSKTHSVGGIFLERCQHQFKRRDGIETNVRQKVIGSEMEMLRLVGAD